MTDQSASDSVRALLAPEFDAAFYAAQLDHEVSDPLGHYLTTGWRVGLDPSPRFSTRFYLERSPDVRRAGLNPLHHYLGWGRREGRAPTPSAAAAGLREDDEVERTIAAAMDQDFYLTSNPELARAHIDPVKHFIAFGHDAGLWPAPDFDTAYYLSRSPDVVEAGINGYFHFLTWGRHEGRAATPEAAASAATPVSPAERLVAPHVDAAFYERRNPGIGRTHVIPFKHYLHFGWRSGLDPSPGFSTGFYRATPYETDAHESPLQHYLRVGRSRGRLPRPLLAEGVDPMRGPEVERRLRPEFDADFYSTLYAGAVRDADPLLDYIEQGWRLGRDPTPGFSTAQYLARFPDVRAMGVNPFLHYLLWGREQGFPGAPGHGETRVVVEPGAAVVPAELRPAALPTAAPDPAAPHDPKRLDLHWIIPDVEGPGRGGHLTIFRTVRWLEAFGHHCTVWVNDPNPAWSEEARGELIQRSYQAIAAEVRSLPESFAFPRHAVVIATSWTTAFVVNGNASARSRFYFVQDDERAFHPNGARRLAAGRTYDFDMSYLCAGPWLAEMLARDHGRWARSFDLSPDERQAPPARAPDNARPRVAFYARSSTDRRAVELGLLAFERLAQSGSEFEVHLFGSDTPLHAAPFLAVDHGVMDPEDLAELYRGCDIGVCFSASNPSLIPSEMMACGLPVLELDSPGTRAVFPPDVVTLAGPDPNDIASALARLLEDLPGRRAQAERARAWVAPRSWEASARTVEAAILERLASGNVAPAMARPALGRPDPIATVVIPTLNGGPGFRRVLDRVLDQRVDWPFEVVVADSQSDDGTWELVQSRPGVRSVSIPRAEFQHGRTRNLAAAQGSGAFIVFLTQDAEPADRLWLGDLVGSLQRHSRAAGAFGRHLPRPGASAFTKRDLREFFAQLGRQPLERSRFTSPERWRTDAFYRRELHFFSNNNACLRRSVWDRLPLPEVDYGEDQLWAARAIGERYSLVYAPQAAVLHSHEYDEASRFERSRVEGRWFRDSFGYDVVPADPDGHVARMNAGDERWGVRNGAPRDQIELKKRLNAAEIAGLIAGQREP